MPRQIRRILPALSGCAPIRDDRAPGSPYFRTLPRFETAEAKYSFLNRLLAVGTGEIRTDGPVHVIEEIL
jgi:hypothetical protein